MKSVTSAPVTATVFAAMTILLYGCIAYDATSGMVDVTAVSVSADGIMAPFGGGHSGKGRN